MDATKNFVVIDMHTRSVVARCGTIAGARRSADKRDLEYGAVRYRGMTAETARTLGIAV